MLAHRLFQPRAVVLLVVVAASASVALLAGTFTPNGTQPPLTHALLSPESCRVCHGDYAIGSHYEPWPSWAGTMMANAGRDPIFWAALDVANDDVPGVGEFCLRCHAPAAWLAGRANAGISLPDLVGDADGCALQGNLDQHNHDFSGVSCHVCHRMQTNTAPPPPQPTYYLDNGQFWIDDVDCPDGLGNGPCRRGPYLYSMGGPEAPHEWAFSPYHTDARVCGNCHNVTNPLRTLIRNGVDTGEPMPVERTHKEWVQSVYYLPPVTSCIDCHMPQAPGNPVWASNAQQFNRVGDLAMHTFAGGNTWIPQVLKTEYPTLGIGSELDATTIAARGMLADSAALAIENAAFTGNRLEWDTRVTNLSGHKLPTGYVEGRRLWLRAVVRGAANEELWGVGAGNAADGSIVSDDPGQLKVYERRSGIWNGSACATTDGMGRQAFHFVLDDCIARDNRIPPLGFIGKDDLETQPVGQTYPETFPGSGKLVNFDLVPYQVSKLLKSPTARIIVQLRYQTASRDYIEFLRDRAVERDFPDDCIDRSTGNLTVSRGELLYSFWEDHGRSAPEVFGAQETTIPVPYYVFADGFESGNTAAWD